MCAWWQVSALEQRCQKLEVEVQKLAQTWSEAAPAEEIKVRSSLSHDGLPQGCQWPGQGSTEVPSSTGQVSQGSGEMLHSMQEVPSSTGQLAQGFGLVPQKAAGAFEGGAIPGRPVWRQSYSRVPSKRMVRGPSFAQQGKMAIHKFAESVACCKLAILVNVALVNTRCLGSPV